MMEIILIIAVILVVIVILFKSNVGKDPSKKTDAMLLREYELHKKKEEIALHSSSIDTCTKLANEAKPIELEMQRRGLLPTPKSVDDNPIPNAKETNNINNTQADQLREEVGKSYDDGWNLAKTKGYDDRGCNEIALTSALYSQAAKHSQVSDDVTMVLQMESMPFNSLNKDAAREAIVEYAVWREYPDLANENIVKNAIAGFGKKGFQDVFGDSDRGKSIPWSKLL